MAKKIEPPKMSFRPLQAAAKETVDANKEAIGDKLAQTLQVLIKSSWDANENKALKLQILKIQRDLKTDTKETKLSAKILKEYNDVALKVKEIQANPKSNVGTALKDSGDTVAQREHVVELLEEIRDRKAEYNKLTGRLGSDLKKSMIGFFGPVSPLVHTFQQLKAEYADEFEKVGKWLGIEKIRNAILLKRLDDQSVRERIMSSKVMTQTKDAIKKLAEKIGGKDGLISNLTSWLTEKGIKPIFDAFRKTGIGKVIEKMGRGILGRGAKLAGGALAAGKALAGKGGSLIRKLLGLGRAGGSKAGGLLGKVGGLLGKGGGKALGMLGKAGSFGLKALGPIGAAVGLGDIFMNSVDKGKTGEDALGDYLQGGMSGAELGAFAGPIGMAVGAALGLAATAITRNWSTVKDAVSKGWDSVSGYMKDGWNAIVGFKDTVFTYVTGLWDSLKQKVDAVVKWFSDHIPGFDQVKAAVTSTAQSAGQQAATIYQNTKAVVSGAAASAAGSALPYAQAASNWASNTFGSDSMIGRAASGISGMVGKAAMPSDAIKGDILAASKATGVDAGYMLATAAQESSFDPNAGAGTSSAKGLYQFTDSTWKMMVDKYGKQYNIGYGDRMDPKKNAIMGALFARDNAQGLAKAGFATGPTELYAAHMLGSGGANQLLSAMKTNPNTDAVALLPKAAAANKNVFFNKDGSHKTVAQVYQFMQDKIGNQSAAYAKALGDQGGATATTTNNDKYDRVPTVKPGADVTVATPKDKGGGAQSAAVANNKSPIKQMPMAVGPTPFLVLQSDMLG